MYNINTMDVVFKKDTNKKTLKDRLSFLKNRESIFYYYVFLLVVGILFLISSTFINRGTTPFTGDYVSQEYAFYTNGYDDWWHFLKTGKFVLYDPNTFLGASNIGSNTFYYLFDPFFFPILLCPRQLIPQGMVILTIFKIATAGLMFYFYMRYLGASIHASKISGLAYAFSGWMAWYLWFNHMTEITIVFPLMLMGVERVIRTKKPWLLAFAIFLMGITNFFFLVCCTFAAFFYAMFRYFQRIKLNSGRDNLEIIGYGFIAFATGLLMSCMVVVPAAIVSLNAPRAQNTSYLDALKECLKNLTNKEYLKKLWDMMTSWKNLTVRSYQIKERNYFPLIEYIFPAMTCREIPLVDYAHSYDNVGGSLFIYYPIIMLLVPALIKSCREKHFSPLIGTALLVAAVFTPFCYYLFHGLTSEPYGRWTLFVETSAIAYVGLYLDKFKKDSNWSLIIGYVTTELLILLACILAHKLTLLDNGEMFSEYVPIKLGGVLAAAYVTIVFVLLRVFKNKKFLHYIFIGLISIEAIAMGAFIIEGHGVEDYTQTNNGLDNNNVLHSIVSKISKNDPDYYRCYSTLQNSRARNDGMRNGYNGLGFFHSVYNFNPADFLNWSAINDNHAPEGWSASYVEKRMNLDEFLGVKYYFVLKEEYRYKKAAQSGSYRSNVPLYFVDITDKYPNDKFYVFENTKFIDLGFSYDRVYSTNSEEDPTATLATNDVIKNEEMYLDGAIANYEDASKLLEESNGQLTVKPSSNFTFKANRITVTSRTPGSSISDEANRYIQSAFDVSKLGPCYRLPVDTLLNIENHPSSKPVTVNQSNNANNDTFVNVIKFPNTSSSNYKYDPKGMMFYLKNYYHWDYRIDVYFVDVDGNIVTWDDHNDQKLTIGSYTSRKTWRGFYIAPTYDNGGNIIKDAPKIDRIIICNKGKKSKSYDLYFDTATNYENRLQKHFDNPLTDVKYGTNKFTFKTNFSSSRVVVTQIAYEDGWSVIARNNLGEVKKLNVYMLQGGFVSFVAPSGNYSYELTYYTPYLELGSYLSDIGLFIFLTSYFGYLYMDNELKSSSLAFDDEFKRKKNGKFFKLFKLPYGKENSL